MSDDIQRTRGRPQNYKFDRGGVPAEMGPYVGVVKNNVDSTRSGRLQVFIEQFAGNTPDDPSLWRWVSYVTPFYGVTPVVGSNVGAGSYLGNPQSYGMWFTPPDIGVKVICFFVGGDPSVGGYYIGCIPEPGVNHMIPAVGASTNFKTDNQTQAQYFAGATQLPVTEINTRNLQISENPRFFDQPKPVHSVIAGAMFQQGIIKDTDRGPITSNSQRESPSSAFGLSTPGRAVYQGGLADSDIDVKLDKARLADLNIIGRRGGHTLVLDDGDLNGKDNLVRLRTAKGHQITMSDTGDFFYILHANGQTWLEFNSEGSVDLYSTNSVNIRTQGTLNLHADKDINMYAGGSINAKAENIKMQSNQNFDLISENNLKLYGSAAVGVRSDGSLSLKSETASWAGGSEMNFKAEVINLNGPPAAPVVRPSALKDRKLPDTSFDSTLGWQSVDGALTTIVTRAPTHEPYAFHNRGTRTETTL
jgi:hypothetical protein